MSRNPSSGTEESDPRKTFYFFIAIAILTRLGILFAFPFLSDDVYRFIWDGRLLMAGHNPFEYLPAHYIENDITVPGIDATLFSKLNSPEYFTIYPPVAQATFALAVWLFPTSLYGSAVVMKTLLFLTELGSIFLFIKLLQHFKLPAYNIFWYILNPLIILEICGNLHFEGAMIFFLLGAIYFLVKGKTKTSAVMMALSIASKLLPLMFLPFLIRRLGWQRSLLYFSILGMTLLLLFMPMLGGTFFSNFGESLDLYFRKFEFNASIYYLLRWIGFQWVGYNMIAQIGPLLAVGTLLGILYLTYKEKEPSWQKFPEQCLWAISLYLLLATTVHPWYLSLPLALCVFTTWRFPILWSFLIFGTYFNYSYPVYHENMYWVTLEYILLASFLFYELHNLTARSKTV